MYNVIEFLNRCSELITVTLFTESGTELGWWPGVCNDEYTDENCSCKMWDEKYNKCEVKEFEVGKGWVELYIDESEVE